MFKVGITGGIGSGKSIVCKIFECLGIPLFSSDIEGRRLLTDDLATIHKIVEKFGNEIFTNGKIDRKKMGELVFNDKEKLEILNSIIHPEVRRSFNNWAEIQKTPYVINEAAILFETGAYKQLDYMILVTAPETLRISRIKERDGLDEATIKDRIKNQWSDEEKMKLTDVVIINDDNTMLIPQVIEIHYKLIEKA